MAAKYMYCPVHKSNCLESGKVIKNFYKNDEVTPVFYCKSCGRYYFNAGVKKGTLDTGRTTVSRATGNKIKIYITDAAVYNTKPEAPNPVQKTKSIFGGSIWKEDNPKTQISGNTKGKNLDDFLNGLSKGTKITNEVRIHMFKKDEAGAKLMASMAHLLVEYPPLGTFNNINDFIKKIFPSNIDQTCIVRNMSYVGINGHIIKRVEIYNKKSSFLKMRLPENTYLAFEGKLSGGELVIDELRVIQNPIMKKDDHERIFVFLYDGPNHPNALWDYANEAAEHPEELKGELADWSSYLDWKRQLAEMRIQGMKYLGIKIDIEERQMMILAVAEGEESYKKFRRYLRRNEVSAFSNVYSSDPWTFIFNHNDTDYKNETGVELVFIEEGRKYTRQEIDNSWNQLRDSYKKYPGTKENPDINYLLGGISRNYFEPYYIELIFELSNSAMEVIERNIRRTGTLPANLEEKFAEEFYGDGYLATSQIGDFALLRRLKTAVFDLSKGKAASQGLDRWLFDISKARLPEKLEHVTEWQNTNINDKQKLAVEKILSTPDVCMIQGPPGTGKTTVIAEAIYQTVLRNKRVLVASQANLAVDNALERLISNPKIRAIRLGSARKIDSSVNNITEEHVLETFYQSIVDYVENRYLNKWKAADAVIESCDNDYARVESLETELDKLVESRRLLERQLDQIDSEWDADSEYRRQMNLKTRKVNLTLLKSYISGNVDDIELALESDEIESIWHEIYPVILELQKYGVWATRVGIDASNLKGFVQISQANDVLQHIFINIRKLTRLRDKLSSEAEFGGESEELELLKIKEQNLREKVLKDMDMAVMQDWKEVCEKINQFSSSGSSLSEREKSLFGKDVAEREQLTSDREKLRAILQDVNPVLKQVLFSGLNCVEMLIARITSQQEEFEKEGIRRTELINQLRDKLEACDAKKLRITQFIEQILKKYRTDRDNLEIQIAEAKESVDDDTGIDRDEWEDILTKFTEWVDDIPDYAQEKDLFLKTFINGCNVVGVSCTENARTLNEAGFDDFDLVIIDEVSKATPPELLIPMLRGRKIVLVGDHRQLPPLFNEHEKTYLEVAQQQEAMSQDNENNMIVALTMADFNKYKDMVTASLFQRYFEHGSEDIKETLTYQYRMHKDIMDIVNLFYDGYLQDGNADKYAKGCKNHDLFIHSTSGTAMIIPERHAYWFDSSTLDGEQIFEQRKPGSTSAENVLEAYAIIEILKRMEIEYANQRSGLPPVSVGVISFYYDQVSTLRSLVKKESFHAIDIEINTVDRFQGKEKEIIIVSLVRNVKKARHNTDSHIAAFQRINVAFSRAQNLLIIVGAKDMYAPQPVVMTDMNNGEEKTVMVYKKIIEMMDMRGTLFNCDEVIPENVIEQIFERLSMKGGVEV